jgi:hypothetical protein
MPEKLHELQRRWLIEATRYNVLPIDDRGAERLNSDLAGRPMLIRGNTQIRSAPLIHSPNERGFTRAGLSCELTSIWSLQRRPTAMTAIVATAPGAPGVYPTGVSTEGVEFF